MSPCGRRGASATRSGLLARGSVEIRSEPVKINRRSAPERADGRLGADESMPAQRRKLSHRNSVPSYDERLALVELAHDLAAVVAQLALSYLLRHTSSVARVLQSCSMQLLRQHGRRL